MVLELQNSRSINLVINHENTPIFHPHINKKARSFISKFIAKSRITRLQTITKLWTKKISVGNNKLINWGSIKTSRGRVCWVTNFPNSNVYQSLIPHMWLHTHCGRPNHVHHALTLKHPHLRLVDESHICDKPHTHQGRHRRH